MILAWRFGYVERPNYKEVEWKAGIDKSSYDISDEMVRLTKDGWEYIERYDRPALHKAANKLLEDWPTILFSVVAAIITSWALYSWGPTAK